MKKIPLIIFVLIFILTGCNNTIPKSNSLANNNETSSINTNNAQFNSEENSSENKNNKICAWIDDSDFIIKLDMPEEYAHYNDSNIFPSYLTGFVFKSSYGDTAYSQMLAKKDCGYRVGFTKEDFANININPNYPLVISIQKDSSTDFSYDNDPIKITLKDGLPEQGEEIVIKINGLVQKFGHYNEIFK